MPIYIISLQHIFSEVILTTASLAVTPLYTPLMISKSFVTPLVKPTSKLQGMSNQQIKTICWITVLVQAGMGTMSLCLLPTSQEWLKPKPAFQPYAWKEDLVIVQDSPVLERVGTIKLYEARYCLCQCFYETQWYSPFSFRQTRLKVFVLVNYISFRISLAPQFQTTNLSISKGEGVKSLGNWQLKLYAKMQGAGAISNASPQMEVLKNWVLNPTAKLALTIGFLQAPPPSITNTSLANLEFFMLLQKRTKPQSPFFISIFVLNP